MTRSYGQFQRVLYTLFVVCALGQTSSVFATCGDYLQHSKHEFDDSRETNHWASGVTPSQFPSKCVGGRCGKTPDKTPLGTSNLDYRVRIRTASTHEDLLQLFDSQNRSDWILPQSDPVPESVSLDQIEPPPRSRGATLKPPVRG